MLPALVRAQACTGLPSLDLVKANLGDLHLMDPHKAIAMKTHLGAPAGLDFTAGPMTSTDMEVRKLAERSQVAAQEIGYYVKDLFILQATSVLFSPNMANQQHARKTHSYFLVLQKGAPEGKRRRAKVTSA